MRLIATLAGTCLAASVLTACGSGGGSGSDAASGGGDLAKGGTFTYALGADPGNLDPQASAASNLFQLSQFAYDPLVGLDSKGKLVPQLASSWTVSATGATLTLRDGITCADGTPFTADDAAANITYVADPAHKSPFLGVFLPAGVTASASGSTLTLRLASPAPFVLEGLSNLVMVCRSGLQDRSVLAHESRGTGPFTVQEDVASDHITYAKRAGYTWGPGGASTSAAGTPDKVVVKIVQNETTAANLLLSGALNAATVLGPDAQRLQKSGLFAAKEDSLLGEMWFNQASGRPGADPAVRKALTQAVDLPQLQKVLTSGQGSAATTLAATPPVACPGSTADKAPAHDLAAGKKTLDDAGWTAGPDGTRAKGGTPLAITFNYNTTLGSGGASAAELAAQAWKQLGAKVTLQAQDETAAVDTLFKTGNWDVAWEQLNVNSPDQLVPFLSGPAVPDGNNFAHIDNATYTAGVTGAMAVPGSAGCGQWLSAERALIAEADVVPFANRAQQTFGKQARFESAGVPIAPTSIRLLTR